MRTHEESVAAYTYLTTRDVAERLSVSRSHVARLIHSGALPAIDIGAGERKEYRIDPDDLKAFVERRRTA